jgi:hypothetical protein
MHTDIGIRPSVSSLAANIQGWIRPLSTQMQLRIASLVKKAKKAMVLDLSANWIHDTIPAVAVLAGAAAFGFWWASISAGLFACFALFLLAAIYKALRQIVVTIRWERHRNIAANSNANTSRIGERSERDFEVSARAIEHLRPWVEDETSLTEERAKACCAVLLDTLAVLHPKFAK